MATRITYTMDGDGAEFRLSGYAGDLFSTFRDLCREHGAEYRAESRSNWINAEGMPDLFLALERAGFVVAAYSAPRPARTQGEAFAASAIVALAGLDADHASTRNDVGFARFDVEVGHSLAEQIQAGKPLSDAQWGLVLRLANKYRKQVGTCPTPDEVLPVVAAPEPVPAPAVVREPEPEPPAREVHIVAADEDMGSGPLVVDMEPEVEEAEFVPPMSSESADWPF